MLVCYRDSLSIYIIYDLSTQFIQRYVLTSYHDCGIHLLLKSASAKTSVFSGILSTYEVLSLGVIRNALASLTQAELIRQPSSEFEGTGKHRLVKVANQDKLVELASQLGIKNL